MQGGVCMQGNCFQRPVIHCSERTDHARTHAPEHAGGKPAGKDLGKYMRVVMDTKFNMSQQCVLAAKRRLMISWAALGGIFPAGQVM